MNDSISKKEIAEIIISGFLENPLQKGRNIFAKCPFCGADTKTHKFSVNPEKGVWGCFKCHAEQSGGGGILSLYSELALGKSVDEATPKEVYKHLREQMSGATSIKKSAVKRVVVSDYKEVTATDDAICHKAYATLLQLKPLALTGEHSANLRRRGMSDYAIISNKYRSFSPKKVLEAYPQYRGTLTGEDLTALAKMSGKNVSREVWESRLALGTEVAKVTTTERVAGFFSLNGKTFCNLSAGMLIPTRNLKGEIVGMQTRRDSGTPRYITLSSADFGGVNANVSRVHIPRGCAYKQGIPVLVTEGGLKADIIKDLAVGEIMVLAIMGVNNTHDLIKSVLPQLRGSGVKVIKEAFDMDKVVNLNVSNALDSLTPKMHQLGLQVEHLVWDEEGAWQKTLPLVHACDEAKLKIDVSGSVYDILRNSVKALTDAGIPLPEGATEWRKEEKGLDDHLLTLAKRKGIRK